MCSISLKAKSLFNSTTHLLNQPLVKEGIKNITGSVTFAFGLVEMYDIYQIFKAQTISTQSHSDFPQWVQIANKVIIICAKISLILSAGISRPGVFIISSLVGCVFSIAQINRAFGLNTTFAINPFHPRHIISIGAVALALPSVIQSVYKALNWVHGKALNYQVQKPSSGTKLQLMTLFNTGTSRPILHLGNRFARAISR